MNVLLVQIIVHQMLSASIALEASPVFVTKTSAEMASLVLVSTISYTYLRQAFNDHYVHLAANMEVFCEANTDDEWNIIWPLTRAGFTFYRHCPMADTIGMYVHTYVCEQCVECVQYLCMLCVHTQATEKFS